MEPERFCFLPIPRLPCAAVSPSSGWKGERFWSCGQGSNGRVPPASVAVIGRDDVAETYSMLYFDARGVSQIYEMSFGDGVWKQRRSAPEFSQRFTGTLSDDGATIAARWEKSSDGSRWDHDFDLIYTRVT